MLISKFKIDDINDEVNSLENIYEIVLPKQYKRFILNYNGGYTPKTKFKIGKISSDIRGFFGVGNVELSINNVELKEWVKINFFPIACDSFGNIIVIGLCKCNTGKIYFCDHEKQYSPEYVVESFNDFIKFCKSEKISEASKLSIEEREAILIANGKGDIITDGLREMWQAEIKKYSNMIQEEVLID